MAQELRCSAKGTPTGSGARRKPHSGETSRKLRGARSAGRIAPLLSRLETWFLRYDHHEIVTSLSARNAMNAEAMAASIAPPATARAIVALRSADRAFSITLRIASKPCAAIVASERLNLI